mgnify:CR=1 FL=1
MYWDFVPSHLMHKLIFKYEYERAGILKQSIYRWYECSLYAMCIYFPNFILTSCCFTYSYCIDIVTFSTLIHYEIIFMIRVSYTYVIKWRAVYSATLNDLIDSCCNRIVGRWILVFMVGYLCKVEVRLNTPHYIEPRKLCGNKAPTSLLMKHSWNWI